MNFDVNHAIVIFLAVLVLGSAWRLASQHLTVSNNPMLQHLGMAMSYQY